jgi:DNA processing protein
MMTLIVEDLLGPLNEVEKKYAPRTLYVVGDTHIMRVGARVSIVGSRKASGFGVARARKLARKLTEHDIVVVSGLAEGVDTAAHTSAIEGGGRTVAVLGTPLDQVYPKKNAKLQQRMGNEHLLISPFPPGSPIQKENFPLRNRTMALISDATVIIEASDSSGSLSQGWEALRLGRPLFITKAILSSSKFTPWSRPALSDDDVVNSESLLGQVSEPH